MTFNPYRKGSSARTPYEQVALAVRILDQEHLGDIDQRIGEMFGARRDIMGRPDTHRNPLASSITRVCRAHQTPPLVADLAPALAALIGDYSAYTTVERYATAGGRPMPTTMTTSSTQAHRYRRAAGYAGMVIDYARRTKRLTLKVVKPHELQLLYGSDDQNEPTVIRHRASRWVDGEEVEVVEIYDLTDLDNPSYTVWHDDVDVTEKVHGQTFKGDGYWWRYGDGTPYHRIVVMGHPDDVFVTNPLVEATLNVCAGWTSFNQAVHDAGFGQRHVRGLKLDGAQSNAETGDAGVATGPETVLRWRDVDPMKPGTHWQDKPAFDPEILGRALRTYEASAMSSIGLPLDYESTGGEPTKRELEAMAEIIAGTFAECRRFDGEVLRRCAAIANALDEIDAEGLSEEPYGVLYRDEVTAALEAAAAATVDDDTDPDTDDDSVAGDTDPTQED